MKIKKIFTALFIILLFIINSNASVLAMNTGFATDEMDPDSQQDYISNINFSLITEEPRKFEICCFDVNEDGMIAIGTTNTDENIISVYSSDFEFMYGYEFDCMGSFGLEWDGSNIIICFLRSSVVASFDEQGKNIDARTMREDQDNYNYWSDNVLSTQRTSGSNTYELKNTLGLFNIFLSSYSQLVKTDSSGNTILLYDVSNSYNAKAITISVLIILFVVFVVSKIISQILKAAKESDYR